MLGVNSFKKDGDRFRLEIISPGWRQLVFLLGLMCFLVGIFQLTRTFLHFKGQLLSELASSASGFALLVFSRVLFGLQQLLKSLLVRYEFDLKARVLRIEGGDRMYRQIPRRIPFSGLKMLRMLILPADGKHIPRYFMEVVLHNGRFYPITAFKSEVKARKIVRELQQALSLPVDEQRIENHSFSDYKAQFLGQFETAVIRE